MGPLIDQLRRRRQKLVAELAEVERAIAAVEGTTITDNHLTLNESSATQGSMMIPEVRVRHSQAVGRKMTKQGKKQSRVVAIANAAGYSLHSLGEHPDVSCTASALSQAHGGTIGIPESRAKAIQKLTRSKAFPKGIEPTLEFWPLLRPSSK